MVRKNKKKKFKKHDYDFSRLFIPAGIFIGMGFGFLYDQLLAGMFIGLGAGFICMAISEIIRMARKKK